jgi:1-acylglycerone phosphate reductase
MAKTVLITGCSEGTIGNSLAIEFAKRGWRVYATARNVTSISNLTSRSNIVTLGLDITKLESTLAARERIERDTGGKLDLLYHNAGVRYIAMAIDTYKPDDNYIPIEDMAMFETNVTAIAAATRVFAPLLIAAKGTIAMTGSVSTFIPQPGSSMYNASKAALSMYARTLRLELKPLGVKVVLVLTAAVATKMTSTRLQFPQDSVYRPVADKVNKGWDDLDKSAMEAAEYSRRVVDKVSRANPPEIVWEGAGWVSVWLVEFLGLQWVYPWLFARWHGLDKPIE